MSWLTLLQMKNLSAWADAIDRSCGRAHVLCYRPGPRPLHGQHNPYVTRILIYYTVSESCCVHCTSFVTVKSVCVVQSSFFMCMHDGCILWARSAMYCQLMHACSYQCLADVCNAVVSLLREHRHLVAPTAAVWEQTERASMLVHCQL